MKAKIRLSGRLKMVSTNKSTVTMNVVDLKTKKETTERRTFTVGVVSFNDETLESELRLNNMLDIKVMGVLILRDNISVELALKTIKSIKVIGVFVANKALKTALKDRIQV